MEASEVIRIENTIEASKVIEIQETTKGSKIHGESSMTEDEVQKRDCGLLSVTKAVHEHTKSKNLKYEHDTLLRILRNNYCNQWHQLMCKLGYEKSPRPTHPRCECKNSICELDEKIDEYIKKAMMYFPTYVNPGADIGYEPRFFNEVKVFDIDANTPELTVEVRHQWHNNYYECQEENRFVLELDPGHSDPRHCVYVLNKKDINYQCDDLQHTHPEAKYRTINQNDNCCLWMISSTERDYRGLSREEVQKHKPKSLIDSLFR